MNLRKISDSVDNLNEQRKDTGKLRIICLYNVKIEIKMGGLKGGKKVISHSGWFLMFIF